MKNRGSVAVLTQERARPAGATAAVTIADLGVMFDDSDTPALDGVSLEVERGQTVLLLGPSGCGKSTLALTVNGLIPHSIPATIRGHVRIGTSRGAASESVAAMSTQVAMVFQDPDAQIVTDTVLDEVAFGPENLLLPVPEVLERSERALRRVGLWDRRGDHPAVLSGGGRQRLAIAAALAMEAEVLVLDEPTANLDADGVAEVYAALRDIAQDGDRTVILIEHNLDAAVAVADSVVAIGPDRRILVGGTIDLLRDEADRLHAAGVWLPTATAAALSLRAAGYRFDTLPLTPGELHDSLAGQGPVAAEPAEASASAAASPAPGAISGAAVAVDHLTVQRGGTTILNDVTLRIPAGAFVAIVGRNGAGKSTLAQMIGGVDPAPRGSVRIDGRIPREARREGGRRAAFVFQNPEHQFLHSSVFAEVAHDLRRRSLPDQIVRDQTDAILDRFDLSGLADRHPFLLSGGEKRRLSVATALAGGAPLLVLDEPTFGLDRARADELLARLEELNAQGATVVVVTHDAQLVSEYADSVVVMARGRVVAHAPTPHILSEPRVMAEGGLFTPPLAAALQDLPHHPHLQGVTRLADLPGARR